MNDVPNSAEIPTPISRWVAWRNALAITLVACLLFGMVCFVLLGKYLAQTFDVYHAAIWLQLGFSVAAGGVFAFVVAWQRRAGLIASRTGLGPADHAAGARLERGHGSRLHRSGLHGRPPARAAHQYAGADLDAAGASAPGPLDGGGRRNLDARPVHERAETRRYPHLAANLRLGTCSAVYHAFQNPTLIGFLPSFFLFSLHAGLYVLGERSLTPVFIAHGIYNVLGEPYLLMMMLAAMPR